MYFSARANSRLYCLRSVDKRVKLRKTCEGGWDPPVSEAGWRKNRSAQTLSFEAAETLGSPLYSRRQQPATQVDLPTPTYRIASLPVYSERDRLSSSSSARVDIVRHGHYHDRCNLIGTSTFRHGLTGYSHHTYFSLCPSPRPLPHVKNSYGPRDYPTCNTWET